MSTTRISFILPNEVLERLDQIAKKADMDRTKLMVNILDECSKSLLASEKIGLLQFTILMRNLAEKMEEWAKTVKKKKIEPLE